MTTESAFHTIQLFLELIGFLVIIFKGGNFVGETQAQITHLAKAFNDYRGEFALHIEKDNRNFEQVNKEISDLRVDLARGYSHDR